MARYLAAVSLSLLAASVCCPAAAIRPSEHPQGDAVLSATELNPAAHGGAGGRAAAASGPLRKRGVGSTHLTVPELAALKGLTWWYSWGPRVWNASVAEAAAAAGVEFVPMQVGLCPAAPLHHHGPASLPRQACSCMTHSCTPCWRAGPCLSAQLSDQSALSKSRPDPSTHLHGACRQRFSSHVTLALHPALYYTSHSFVMPRAVGPRGCGTTGHLPAAWQPCAAWLQRAKSQGAGGHHATGGSGEAGG